MKMQEMKSIIILSWEFQHLNLSAHTLADTLTKLRRLSAKLDRLNTAHSNGIITPKQEKEALKAVQKVRQICADTLKCSVYINQDPRGTAIGLILPSGASNSMDGKTWRIDY